MIKEKIEIARDLNDLMDTLDTDTVRKDLVYTLIVKAWDIGYCEGCEAVRDLTREWANDN